MNEERLAKLNAYLISKGKPPKKMKKDFVKANMKTMKRVPLANNSNSMHSNDFVLEKKNLIRSKKINGSLKCSASKENNNSMKSIGTGTKKIIKCKTAINLKNNLEKEKGIVLKKTETKTPNKKFRKSLRKSAALNLSHLKNKTGNIFPVKHCYTPTTPKTSEKLRKKLIRRSVNTSIQKSRNNAILSKNLFCKTDLKSKLNLMTPNKKIGSNYGGSKSVQPKSRIQSRIMEKKSKTPRRKKSLSMTEQQNARLEKLRRWIISKGKNPDHLRGFKPVKTFLTPTNSPSTNKPLTPGGSFWPTLRGEDYFDELSILVKNSMEEARACLDKGCSAQEVFELLKDFKTRVSVAEEHAAYWVTFAQVHEIFGNTEEEIIEIYENAIKKQAKPLSLLKEELKNFLVRVANQERLTQKAGIQMETATRSTNDINLPEKQQNFEDPINKLPLTNSSQKEFQSPVFNFKTPSKKQIAPISPLCGTPSPSSVVKLRMIPKSSPLFKQLVARRALPFDASAIVTPVRRSRRIENSTTKYPKVVQGHDSCISTPHALMKGQHAKESCNFVFDSNDALGVEYNDISKLLHL